MTQLERRQERIRRIQARSLGKSTVNSPYEQVTTNPDVYYCIGKLETHPEHIGLFVQKNRGDPAVQVYALQPLTVLSLIPQTELHSEFEKASPASNSISTGYWRC